jgi:shikimate kinase
MGSGKSSVGKHAAEQLDFRLVDTDELIERRMGKPITEIFKRYGESFFRELEKNVMRELSSRTHLVVATGGGAVLADENWREWKRSGIVACLGVDAETAYRRTRHHTNRPLLQGTDAFVKILDLMAQRASRYAKADFMIDTVGKTPESVARMVVEKYFEKTK